jgi:uncharacterized protein YkwD
MDEQPQDSFREKYRIVIILVAVFVLLVLVTNLPNIYNFFTSNIGSEGYSFLQQIQYSGKSIPPSASREALTRDAVIEMTNKARADNGLPPLAENQLLNSIAESRAGDMLEKQYFAHVSPSGQQASDIAQSVGYAYKIIAENIGSGDFYTNQKIVDGWMQSPGHRVNILSTEVQEIGAAVMKGRMKGMETYITVQIFGLPSLPVVHNVCAAPSENLMRDIEVKKSEIEALHDQLNRLKVELDAEQASIEKDQNYTYNDAQKIQKINDRINAFNEKSRWYNKLVSEAKGKAAVTESMVKEYNRSLQTYNECRASNKE